MRSETLYIAPPDAKGDLHGWILVGPHVPAVAFQARVATRYACPLTHTSPRAQNTAHPPAPEGEREREETGVPAAPTATGSSHGHTR